MNNDCFTYEENSVQERMKVPYCSNNLLRFHDSVGLHKAKLCVHMKMCDKNRVNFLQPANSESLFSREKWPQ